MKREDETKAKALLDILVKVEERHNHALMRLYDLLGTPEERIGEVEELPDASLDLLDRKANQIRKQADSIAVMLEDVVRRLV